MLNRLGALRYRAFVSLVLLLHRTAAHAARILWLYKPLTVPAPGKYGVLATVPLLALWLSLRDAPAGAAHRNARRIHAE